MFRSIVRLFQVSITLLLPVNADSGNGFVRLLEGNAVKRNVVY